MSNKLKLLSIIGSVVMLLIIVNSKRDKVEEPVKAKPVTKSQAKFQPLDAVIDFEGMNAFSVERTLYNNESVTIVGWLLNDKLQLWYLRLSPDDHNKLLKDFKQYLIDRE